MTASAPSTDGDAAAGFLPREVMRVAHLPKLAHVVTVNPDGTPQISLVWIGPRGAELVFFAESSRQKVRNLRRDPRIWLSIEDQLWHPVGLPQYLVVHGLATVTDGPDAQLQDAWARMYLGVDTYPFANRGAPSQVVVSVRPQRFSGLGPHRGGDPWADEFVAT